MIIHDLNDIVLFTVKMLKITTITPCNLNKLMDEVHFISRVVGRN